MKYISMSDFLMNRIKLEDLSPELLGNANTIVPRANELLEHFGQYRSCNSGYRSAEDQARINPKASKSKHMTCQAIDFEDKDGKFKNYCLTNLKVLETIGLWMEDPSSTPTWLHIQCVPPGSGHRVFKP